MEIRDFLMTLSRATCISGHEYTYSSTIKQAFEQYCDTVYQDAIGNVIGIRKSKKENACKVMLAAHMDEIGLMVKEIDDRGFLRFTNIGGFDTKILPAKEVVVHGKQDLFGVIGAKPPHLQSSEESSKAVKMEDMAIDLGMTGQQVKELVSIGDTISFNMQPKALDNDYICGKSLDDRCGIAVILECLEELKNTEIDIDIYAVATVQEEVGLRGAIVSSYHIEPDIGIAIDVCHGETPDAPKDDTSTTGKGPVVAIGPNIHPELSDNLMEAAKQYNISYQVEVEPGNTGTDAWAIQVARSGIPTILLSVPLRYMHTMVETLSYNDVKNAGKMLAFFLRMLDCNHWKSKEVKKVVCD